MYMNMSRRCLVAPLSQLPIVKACLCVYAEHNVYAICSLSRDVTDQRSPEGRPTPAPRRSVSSRDTSREPSMAPDSHAYSSPSYQDVERTPSQYGG